jgi:hypothetical protein
MLMLLVVVVVVVVSSMLYGATTLRVRSRLLRVINLKNSLPGSIVTVKKPPGSIVTVKQPPGL